MTPGLVTGGLPRARGDGPSSGIPREARHGAPPRTRGWTHHAGSPAERQGGSPAHAGMDPASRVTTASSRWLPRARGDGPLAMTSHRGCEMAPRARGDGPPACEGSEQRRTAPPRTRGWTMGGPGHEWFASGSPAHAGMDPAASGSPSSTSWLPRARGDGPLNLSADVRPMQAPPRTRGWTPRTEGASFAPSGSPAHAGMDPYIVTRARLAEWLPRARGDGPPPPPPPPPKSMAPPRTRGWTSSHGAAAAPPIGSPAHAGMDPVILSVEWWDSRLPRARGDGPTSLRSSPTAPRAPPRTRGWTPHAARAAGDDGGSPAHAGMDHPGAGDQSAPVRLPRARGDGPLRSGGSFRGAEAPPRTRGWTALPERTRRPGSGSPAHAGMDPSSRTARSRHAWLPRARGDGPLRELSTSFPWGAPPRTRGWTHPVAAALARALGSPAHAGMDPGSDCAPSGWGWLPRARGDGPSRR